MYVFVHAPLLWVLFFSGPCRQSWWSRHTQPGRHTGGIKTKLSLCTLQKVGSCCVAGSHYVPLTLFTFTEGANCADVTVTFSVTCSRKNIRSSQNSVWLHKLSKWQQHIHIFNYKSWLNTYRSIQVICLTSCDETENQNRLLCLLNLC